MGIKAVVFDFGGVLIDWNPEYLDRQLIPDEAERRWFLTHVCSMDWVVRQDGGQPIVEATAERVAQFPDHEALIRAFYERWHEMVAGVLDDGVAGDVSVCMGTLSGAAAFQGHHRVRASGSREARSGDLRGHARADQCATAGHRADRACLYRRQPEERGRRHRARLARRTSHQRGANRSALARIGFAGLTGRASRNSRTRRA